jgi:hypothetical protein
VLAVSSYRVLPNAPSVAQEEGTIKPGDQLLSINGIDVKRFTPNQIGKVISTQVSFFLEKHSTMCMTSKPWVSRKNTLGTIYSPHIRQP